MRGRGRTVFNGEMVFKLLPDRRGGRHSNVQRHDWRRNICRRGQSGGNAATRWKGATDRLLGRGDDIGADERGFWLLAGREEPLYLKAHAKIASVPKRTKPATRGCCISAPKAPLKVAPLRWGLRRTLRRNSVDGLIRLGIVAGTDALVCPSLRRFASRMVHATRALDTPGKGGLRTPCTLVTTRPLV